MSYLQELDLFVLLTMVNNTVQTRHLTQFMPEAA